MAFHAEPPLQQDTWGRPTASREAQDRHFTDLEAVPFVDPHPQLFTLIFTSPTVYPGCHRGSPPQRRCQTAEDIRIGFSSCTCGEARSSAPTSLPFAMATTFCGLYLFVLSVPPLSTQERGLPSSPTSARFSSGLENGAVRGLILRDLQSSKRSAEA